MRKYFSKRPSPAMFVAIIALVAASTGGAIAATKVKKVEYKGLSKDARLKVLPFNSTGVSKSISVAMEPKRDPNKGVK